MPCNCQKSSAARRRPFTIQNPPKTDTSVPKPTNTTQAFALVKPDGSSTTYSSKLEADAAWVRSGYVGRVQQF